MNPRRAARILVLGVLVASIGAVPTAQADHNGECMKHDGLTYVCQKVPPCDLIPAANETCEENALDVIAWVENPRGDECLSPQGVDPHQHGVLRCNDPPEEDDEANRDPGVYVVQADSTLVFCEAFSPGHEDETDCGGVIDG